MRVAFCEVGRRGECRRRVAVLWARCMARRYRACSVRSRSARRCGSARLPQSVEFARNCQLCGRRGCRFDRRWPARIALSSGLSTIALRTARQRAAFTQIAQRRPVRSSYVTLASAWLPSPEISLLTGLWVSSILRCASWATHHFRAGHVRRSGDKDRCLQLMGQHTIWMRGGVETSLSVASVMSRCGRWRAVAKRCAHAPVASAGRR